MENNKQQTAVEWLAEQIRNYKTPLNYGGVYFVFIHQDMINRFEKQAKEMYQDEIEAAIIKNCATDSTSEASQYASGYSSGYQRALEMVKWKIDNELRSK